MKQGSRWDTKSGARPVARKGNGKSGGFDGQRKRSGRREERQRPDDEVVGQADGGVEEVAQRRGGAEDGLRREQLQVGAQNAVQVRLGRDQVARLVAAPREEGRKVGATKTTGKSGTKKITVGPLLPFHRQLRGIFTCSSVPGRRAGTAADRRPASA